ncbi:hypothetical protein GCM10011579_077200 [Streptomyces albiflavescens]|uniref:Uncharacterized protein n=1 Tax=Streptomyces albiflavescens TaxID=1623582 RepID=A0A917YCJ3_9ACTN|nr:hypothetical protein [Streptomyces albiflavescens]GGN85931.1 hypothetical protein GCM10011579_077200 [Streptomyces albiflavescens]
MPEFSASTVRIQAPDDAVSLPVRELVDLDAWAADAARQRAGADGDQRLIEALADELREAAEDARGRGPVTALSYVPEPRLGELARIELSALVADETYPTVTVDLLRRYLTTPTEISYRPPVAELRTLPAGPAVRVRHAYVQDADRDGTGTVLETCAYGICPDEKWALVLLTSWRALAHTDALCTLTDDLARTVSVN